MKRLLIAVALVALCAVFPAFAVEKPPHELFLEVNAHPLAARTTCEYEKKERPCLVYINVVDDVMFVVLFTEGLEVTHVIEYPKMDETKKVMRWVRSDVSS